MKAGDEDQPRVKSAERALGLIQLLSDSPAGLAYPEIVRVLGLPKSSAHNLLSTVVASGFVEFDPSDRVYRLGIKTFEAGQAWVRSRDLVSRSNVYLDQVRDRLNETCQLAVLDGTENVYLAKAEADHVLTLQSNVGDRLPAYATGLGKVLLAALSEAEVRRRFTHVTFAKFTDNTIKSIDELIQELSEIRSCGYATDMGEYTPGVACIAVPVRDHTGHPVAAMSVSAPEVRRSEEWATQTLDVLTTTAADFSKHLGYNGDA